MTLPYTLDQVRTRELAFVKTIGRPNPWWPGDYTTNDCVGYQTERLGLRTGHETLAQLSAPANRHWISIAAFRAHYQFPEVPPEAIRPGDLVLSNWTGTHVDGGLEPEHMEWAYSHDRAANRLEIVGANTGPVPGKLQPNGVWRKTRPLDGHIVLGIRLPYRDDKPAASRRHVVQVVAVEVNAADLGKIPHTTAAGPGPDTGYEGENYWRRVQTWGRKHGYYPSGFVIDGIPGPQSRLVEAAAYKAATAKK